MNRQLAKVRSFSFDMERCMSFFIHVEYEDSGMSQGVGGVRLDQWNKEKQRAEGTAFGCEVIRRLLEDFQVSRLEDLKDKGCWVYGRGKGLGFAPTGIAPLRTDNSSAEPIIFGDIAREFIGDDYDA